MNTQVNDIDIFSPLPEEEKGSQLKYIVGETFSRGQKGIAAPILYGDKLGASYYGDFTNEHATVPSQTPPAKIISQNISFFVNNTEGVERLIVIGGGPKNNFLHQEGVIIEEILKRPSPTTDDIDLEVVLLDVSPHYLREDVKALQDISDKTNKTLRVIPIQAAFEKVAGRSMDKILEGFGTKPRNEFKTTVISTGGTFGNIENPQTTSAVPIKDIEQRMALFGQIGGVGSTVIFDAFKNLDAEDYYQTNTLKKFMVNFADVAKRECLGLENFETVRGYTKLFGYDVAVYEQARLIEHNLITTQAQNAVLKNGINRALDLDGTYPLIYSFRPEPHHITNRKPINTGLESDGITGNGLIFYAFKTVSEPSVLISDEGVSMLTNPDDINLSPNSQKPIIIRPQSTKTNRRKTTRRVANVSSKPGADAPKFSMAGQ